MDEEEDVKSGDINLHEAQERSRIRKPSKKEEPTKELPMRVRIYFEQLSVLCLISFNSLRYH